MMNCASARFFRAVFRVSHKVRLNQTESMCTEEGRGWRSSHLQPLNDGLDAGVGPNGSKEWVLEREIASTDVRRGALHPPLDRPLSVAKPPSGICVLIVSLVTPARSYGR